MAINFTHTPPTFSPVYTDGLFFTVSADTNHFKFRYVYDIYVDGVAIFNGKATPNPFGLGIIDVSRILKTYVSNNPIAYWDTTPIYTHQTFPFSRPYQDETIKYEVLVGYEYASDEVSPVTGFTGGGVTGDTIGAPAETAGVFKTFQSTMGVNGRSNEQDFDIGPFVLSGSPVGTNPTTSGLFLTNSPRNRDIQPTEYYTLGFTNYYLDGTTVSEPYYVEYKFYDDNGTLLDTQTYENITTNGGGPLPDCTYVYPSYYLIEPTGNTEYNTLYVGAGPKNLESVMPADTAQYTVQLFGKFTGTTSPVQPTPTPTPTPSSTPTQYNCSGNCYNFSITNNNLGECEVSYYDCTAQRTTQIVIPGQTSALINCACVNSLVYDCELDILVNSFCTEIPCDTCFRVTALNNSASPVTYYYYDCDLGSWTGRTQPELTGVILDCVCNTFYSNNLSDMQFEITAICGDSPIASPTPTPTPTPTCPGFIAWNIITCGGTCDGGLCTCTSPEYDTVYTDCTVTDLTDPGTAIYTTSTLTSPYIGDFQWIDDAIYNSTGSDVVLVCNIGGPC